MSQPVSAARLHLLRVAYVATFAFLGLQVWPGLVAGPRDWEPLSGVAVSLYGALSVLCLLGVRNPLGMLPLLLLQLSYKSVWLAAVWLPFQLDGRADELHVEGFDLFAPFVAVVVLDLLVIPWGYVAERFVRAGGDHRRAHRERPGRSAPGTRSRPAAAPPSGAKQPSKA